MKILNKMSVKHFCLVLITLSLASFSLQAQTTLYVDNSTTNAGDGSSSTSPLATLGEALDLTASGSYTINLAETGIDYIITHNTSTDRGEKTREIGINQTIQIQGNNQQIHWDILNVAEGGRYGDEWMYPLSALGSLELNNCILDFSDPYRLESGINVEGELQITNCVVKGITTNLMKVEEGTAHLSYCHFQGITSISDDINTLVSSGTATINPICFSEDLSDPQHIIYNVQTTVLPGTPATGVDILIESGTSTLNTHVATLPSCVVGSIDAGEFTTLIIDANETVSCDTILLEIDNDLIINGTFTSARTLRLPENYELTLPVGAMLTAENLDILDGVRIVNEGTIHVVTNVHVYGDAFVQTNTVFGNTETTVDLAFTTNAYRYFTPPFDIAANAIQGGTLETDLGATATEGESIWLWAYDEETRSQDQINGWVFNESTEMQLEAGRGYSIWSLSDKLTFTSNVTYPNLDGLEICEEIMYTANGENTETGYNFLGNMYSAPLILPVSDDNGITAYYQCNDAGEYTCMSGTVGGISAGGEGSFDLDLVVNMTIGSYGVFFSKATSEACQAFHISNLDLQTETVRVKSEEVEEEPSEYLRVAISNDNSYDDFVVLFEDNGEYDYDNFDADKIYPTSALLESTRTLMSVGNTVGEENYVIQGLPSLEYLEENKEISLPIHIRPLTSGDYTIAVTLTEIEEQEMSIALYDNVTDVTTPLSSTETATISLTASETKTSPSQDDVNDRYSLVVTPKGGVATTIETEEETEMTILSNDNFISVNAGSLIGKTVTLYDVSGRLMYENTFTSTIDISTVDFTPGFYVVVASDVNGQLYKEKVMIR